MILGIDVAKNKLDINVLHDNGKQNHYAIKNTPASIKRLMTRQLKKRADIKQVVFEPTGSYEKHLQVYLMDHHIPYHKAHPSRLNYFRLSEGHFAKSDKIDARCMTLYSLKNDLPNETQETRQSMELKELASRKQQLKRNIQTERNRLEKTYLTPSIRRSIKKTLRFLEKELAQIVDELQKLVSADEALQAKQKLLETVKGVGPEVSSVLITELPELGMCSRSEIAHLVGVAPRTNDSGLKQGHRAVSQGRFNVRRALYMAALVASRHNPRMKLIYTKLVAKGKKKKVAIVAIMRKMIIMMNAMVKNNLPWQAERNLVS